MGVEKQATIRRQLEFARQSNTDEAWWSVLTSFQENGEEKHRARQALIPRLIRRLELVQAERLCREITSDRNAPEAAMATAGAGLAVILGLQGKRDEARRTWERDARPHEMFVPRELGDWWRELTGPRRPGEGPPFEPPNGGPGNRSRVP